MCGERPLLTPSQRHSAGSSPRVWGTLNVLTAPRKHCRFIPTCVGNASNRRRFMAQAAVHPHVCGERLLAMCILFFIPGSSPRVWGTRSFLIFQRVVSRFIPTCVGNAIFRVSFHRYSPVHPHVCGERCRRITSRAGLCGSSPRVWGTLEWSIHRKQGLRFIPTCVGNAYSLRMRLSAITVHPHVCGERPVVAPVTITNAGSSPRVWGTPTRRVRYCCEYRFIPTCVGNAFRVHRRRLGVSVHPHVCGERGGEKYEKFRALGSSPRVWGTQRKFQKIRSIRRFIPTCVGNALGAEPESSELTVPTLTANEVQRRKTSIISQKVFAGSRKCSEQISVDSHLLLAYSNKYGKQ